jgi:hypothetical protein
LGFLAITASVAEENPKKCWPTPGEAGGTIVAALRGVKDLAYTLTI